MLVLDLADFCEEILETSREETYSLRVIASSLNSESLARSGLAIGENRAAVAHQALVNYSSTDLLEYFDLGCLFSSHIVKGEFFIIGELAYSWIIW